MSFNCGVCRIHFNDYYLSQVHAFTPQHHQQLEKMNPGNRNVHDCRLCGLEPTDYDAWLRHIREKSHCERLKQLKNSSTYHNQDSRNYDPPDQQHRSGYDDYRQYSRSNDRYHYYRSGGGENHRPHYDGRSSRQQYDSRDNYIKIDRTYRDSHQSQRKSQSRISRNDHHRERKDSASTRRSHSPRSSRNDIPPQTSRDDTNRTAPKTVWNEDSPNEPTSIEKVIQHATSVVNNVRKGRELRLNQSGFDHPMSLFSIPPPDWTQPPVSEPLPVSEVPSLPITISDPENAPVRDSDSTSTNKAIPAAVKQNLLAKATAGKSNQNSPTSVSTLDTGTIQRLLFGPKTARQKKIMEDISKQSSSIRVRANSREETTVISSQDSNPQKEAEKENISTFMSEDQFDSIKEVEQTPVAAISEETPLSSTSDLTEDTSSKSSKNQTKRKHSLCEQTKSEMKNNYSDKLDSSKSLNTSESSEISKIQQAIKLNEEEEKLNEEIESKKSLINSLNMELNQMMNKRSQLRKARKQIYSELQTETGKDSHEEDEKEDVSESRPTMESSSSNLVSGKETERDIIRKVILSEKSKDYNFEEIDQLIQEQIDQEVVSSSEQIQTEKKRRLSSSSCTDSVRKKSKKKKKSVSTSADTTVDLDDCQLINVDVKPPTSGRLTKDRTSSSTSSDDCEFNSLREPLIKEHCNSWQSGQFKTCLGLIDMELQNNSLLICGPNSLSLINLKTFECFGSMNVKLTKVGCIAVYKNQNRTLIYLGSGKILVQYLFNKGETLRKIFSDDITVIREFSKQIYIGLSNGRVFVIDIEKNATVNSYKGCDTKVISLQITKEGSRHLILCASKEEITIRVAASGLFLRNIYLQDEINSISLHGHTVFVHCHKTVAQYCYTNGKLLSTLSYPKIICSLSISKKHLCLGDIQGYITIFKINDKQADWNPVKSYVMCENEPVTHLICTSSNDDFPDYVLSANQKGLVMVRLITVQSLICKYGDCNQKFNNRDELIYHVAKDHVLSCSSEYVTCAWSGCCYLFNTSKQGYKSIESHVESHV